MCQCSWKCTYILCTCCGSYRESKRDFISYNFFLRYSQFVSSVSRFICIHFVYRAINYYTQLKTYRYVVFFFENKTSVLSIWVSVLAAPQCFGHFRRMDTILCIESLVKERKRLHAYTHKRTLSFVFCVWDCSLCALSLSVCVCWFLSDKYGIVTGSWWCHYRLLLSLLPPPKHQSSSSISCRWWSNPYFHVHLVVFLNVVLFDSLSHFAHITSVFLLPCLYIFVWCIVRVAIGTKVKPNTFLIKFEVRK